MEGPQGRPGHPPPVDGRRRLGGPQLADRIGSCGWRAIESAVAQAIATYDPHLFEPARSRAGRLGSATLPPRGLHRRSTWVGTSDLDITGDTLDLTAFHDLVCEQAAQLKALGDTDTLEIRKAKAVGVIANRQAALDLGTLLGHHDQTPADRAIRSPPVAKTKLYLHLTLSDLLGLDGRRSTKAAPGSGRGAVRAGHHRPDQGLGRPVPGHYPTRPRHGPHRRRRRPRPTRLDAELVILRDQHCVFPWCNRDARACDLDHITPYEENGPPGQTRPDGLAALCRRHHRAKTFRRWRYHRTPSGDYQWTGPHGQTYLVTPPAPSPSRPTEQLDHRPARSPGHQPGHPACLRSRGCPPDPPGPPGIGKSPIGRLYVAAHWGSQLKHRRSRRLIDDWEEDFRGAGELIRPTALAMITAESGQRSRRCGASADRDGRAWAARQAAARAAEASIHELG